MLLKTTDKIKQVSKLVDTDILADAVMGEKESANPLNAKAANLILRQLSDSRSNSITEGIDNELLPCIRIQIVEISGLNTSRLLGHIVGCRIVSEEGVVFVDGHVGNGADHGNGYGTTGGTDSGTSTVEFDQLNIVVHHGSLPKEIANYFIRIQIIARSSYPLHSPMQSESQSEVASTPLFQGAVDISLTELLIATGHNIEKAFIQSLSGNACKIVVSTAASQALLNLMSSTSDSVTSR
jgi:hypothetical protein